MVAQYCYFPQFNHSFLPPPPSSLQFFTDGITNKLLGCYVGAVMQDVVLVRIYGNKTELLVDRENEVKSFRVLHAHRCAPRLYCTFNNGLCYEFLEGMALEPEDIRSQPVFRLKTNTHLEKIHIHCCLNALFFHSNPPFLFAAGSLPDSWPSITPFMPTTAGCRSLTSG